MKVALVTGAASGIGLAVAKKFLDEGYMVFGMSRRTESPIDHPNFHYISGDISVSADRERLVDASDIPFFRLIPSICYIIFPLQPC